MNIVSFIQRYWDITNILNRRTMDEILEMQRLPVFGMEKKIGPIRKEHDKAKRQELKANTLPMFMPNGTFAIKKDHGLIDYGQFTVMDLDHCDIGLKEAIYDVNFVKAVYISPSGDGLKVVVKHDNENPAWHRNLYSQLIEDFESRFPVKCDRSTSGLSSAHFLSFDPEMRWKDDCDCATFKFQYIQSEESPKQDWQVWLQRFFNFPPRYDEVTDDRIIAFLFGGYDKTSIRDHTIGNRHLAIKAQVIEMYGAGVDVRKIERLLKDSYGEDMGTEIDRLINWVENSDIGHGSKRDTIISKLLSTHRRLTESPIS